MHYKWICNVIVVVYMLHFVFKKIIPQMLNKPTLLKTCLIILLVCMALFGNSPFSRTTDGRQALPPPPETQITDTKADLDKDAKWYFQPKSSLSLAMTFELTLTGWMNKLSKWYHEVTGYFSGNQLQTSLTITTFDCPAALSATCSISEHPAYANLSAFLAAGGDTLSDCGMNVSSFTLFSEVSDGNTCPEIVTRTYQIDDLCGGSAQCTQTITIDDNIVPVMASPPAAITVDCITDVPAMTNLGWTDNCDGSGNVAGTDGPLTGGNCGGTITRSWTYTDACGNAATTVTQTITVDDTTPPVMASPPTAITVECIADVPAMTNLGWTDNCDGSGNVAGTDGPLTGGNCGGTITRSWTYTDACGNNATTVTQTITVDDTTPPVMASPPAAITVDCITDVPAMTNLGWTDNCDGSGNVAGTDGPLTGGNCGGTITRSWTYTDACGNNATAVTQTITVDDTTPPVMASPPAAITVDCITDVPAMTNLGWTDNCDGSGNVAGTDGPLTGGNCGGTITRSWTYTDACGNNAITVTQTITVDDTTPPVMASPPAAITVDCITDVPAMTNLGWTDNCDGSGNVAGTDGPLTGGNCGGTITRSWTYTDACGNAATTVTQTITVDDTTPPVMASPPAAITVDCITDVPAMTNLGWTDNCDGSGNVAGTDGPLTGGNCGGTITRSWTYTDACGNNATTVTQTITVDDTTPPVMASPPAAITVDCITDVPAMTNLGWTDNCDGSGNVAGTDGPLTGGNCGGTITRSWAYTDACGNNATAVTQTITVDDTTPPVMASPPAAITVDCITDVPAMTNLGWTDNCDGSGNVVGTDGPLTGGNCGGTITRSWTYTDACGNNATTVTQTITVDDTTPPVMASPPAAITVDCITDVPAMTNLGWTDNCDGSGNVAGTDGPLTGGNCGGTITRSWTYTDACGNNATTVTQTITVDDTTPPVMASPPAAITVDCITDVPAMTNLGWTDNCDGSGNVAGTDGPLTGGNCSGTITRNWTYTDACGNNAITVTQTITIDDTTPPVMASPPAAITVECITDVPAMTNLGWTDNCDGSGNVAGTDGPLTGGNCGGTITRSWTYTDACGNNAITVTQTITVDDTTPPVMASPPAAITVDCITDVPAMTNLGWTDNCDGSGNVAGTDSPLTGGNCGGTITRSWTYIDACGNNATTVTQTITVDDTTPPVMASPPAAITVDCITNVPAMTNLGWTDNCDGSGNVAGTDGPLTGGNCSGTITRSWTYTDACGNVATTVTQTITVDDTTPPVMASPPAAITVDCITDVPAMTNLGWTDNCDGSGNVAGTDGPLTGGNCGGTITRSWTYTDACGNNATTVTQTITVDDTTPPVMASPPAAITVDCITDVPAMTNLGWTDNCDGSGNVAGTDGPLTGGNCGGTITRSWTYTDACGNNAITVTQTITVDDTTPPVMASPPAAITVDCITDVPAMTNLGWTDNCDGSGNVAGTDGPLTGGNCGGTITRSWTYTDACGNNATTVTQTITIDDTTPPLLATAPPDASVACYPTMTELSWTDNCDGSGMISGVDVSDGNSCPEVITRTWTYTDGCGNSDSQSQTFTINDVTPPVATCPDSISVTCPSFIPPPDPSIVTVSDNCGNVTVTFEGEVSTGFYFNGGSCPDNITRTYRATDDCGNFTECTQIINVQDPCDPDFICPLCDSIVPYFQVDLTGVPDSLWQSPSVSRDGLCCDAEWPDNCIQFSLILDPNSIGITVEVLEGANPGILFYELECGDSTEVGEGLCLEGGQVHNIIICKPGSNPNVYGITSIPGDIVADSLSARVECSGEIVVSSNAVDSTIVWTDLTGGGVYNSFLSCTMGCDTTIFTPDNTAPPLIRYEVCGDIGNLNCATTVTICDTVIVEVLPEVIVSISPDPPVFCADNVQPIVANVMPPEANNYIWYDGPNGTGSAVGTLGSFTPSTSGNYSLVATDDSDLVSGCNADTLNFTVTINPLPVFDLGGDQDNCIGTASVITLPAAYSYDWSPTTGVSNLSGNEFSVQPGSTTSYTVTATSAEGCTSVETMTVTIFDCIQTCPQQAHCSAGDIVTYTTVSQFENAGGSINFPCNVQSNNIALVSAVSDGNSCPETITHTYQIWDHQNCGDTTTCDVIIVINDIQAPVLTNVPTDETVDCDAVPPPDTPTATDDCDANVSIMLDEVISSGNCSQSYTITRSWTAVDDCGNSVTSPNQVITVNPPPIPTIQNVPGPVTVACTDPLPPLNDLPYDNGLTGTCQIMGTVSGVQSGTIDPCVISTITYTWSGNDICGNPLTPVTQTITVNPAPAPTIQNVPADVTIDCDDPLPALNDLTYDNNLTGTCQITGTVSGTQSGTIDPCVASTITYTWSGNDICGNPLIPVTQTITVNPAPAPTIQNVPADVTIDCDDPLPALNDLTYDNNITGTCQITGTVSGVQSGTIDPCGISTITYTWSGNDICGNPLTPVTQMITVNPAPAPTIQNVPPAITINCDDALPALNDLTYDNGLTGTCQITGTVSGTQSGTIDPCVISTITYTWSGNDICGNPLIPVTQTITVNPAPAPTIQNVPADVTIDCDDPLPADLTYDNNLTGTCQITGTVSGTQSGTIDPCVASTITYTWSGNDICGNPLTPVTQTITVNPAPAPTIQNVPADVTIDCDDPLPALNDLTYDNNLTGTCQITGTVSGTQSGTIDPCVASTITYTWSGNDICGNPLTPVTQTITVNPAPAPTIQNVPADVTIDCDDPLPALNDLTYDNNLTGTCQITGTVSGTQSGTIDPCVASTITYTWSGNDICGNPLTPVTQTITVNPAPAPTIQNVPADVTIDCDDPLPALNDLTYDNNLTGTCQITGTVSGTQSGTIDPCVASTITYTWSGNDICGNPLTPVTQTITVNPAPAPTIQNVPADVTIDCDDPLPALNDLTYDNNLTGTCQITGTVSGTQSGTIDPCVISTITYTWSGNDICGNPLTPVTQTITVNPAPTPTIQNVPADVTIDCDDPLPTLNDLTYDNNLTGTCQITGTVSGTQSGTIDPCVISTITYTWSGNDICGNPLTPVTQTITVNPAPTPTIQNVPADVTIDCDDPLPALNDLTYDNNLTGTCQITGTVSGTQSGTIDPCVASTITYTWSGNDICGNPLTPVTQTITVNPAPAPTIQNVPADVTIDCDDPLPALNDLTYDNNLIGTCQITGTVSGTQSGTIDPCVASTITYTWSDNDICGNPLTPVTQTITVNPAPAPTIQNVPAAVTIDCDDPLPALNDLTYDNNLTGTCQITGTVSGTQSGTIDPCIISTITYTWSGNDICGNPLTPVTQTITVNPAPAPTIQNVPADVTIDCDDPLPALNDLTYDNNLTGTCQITGTVSGTQSGTIDPCGISTITYTWSGNDICGNPLTPVTQTITVNPAPAPTIQNVPPAITINCDDALPALNDLPYDNGLTGTCQITGTVSGTQSGTIDPCVASTITYTWSGNDICGNPLTPVTQTITVNPAPAPTIQNVPPAITINCDDALPALNDLTYDNGLTGTCQITGTVSGTQSGTINPCVASTITYTWSGNDICGNPLTPVTQTITVNPAPAPTIQNVPPAITINCDDALPALNDLTYDNGLTGTCQITGTVSGTQSGTIDPCVISTITYTWSGNDICGNPLTPVTQTITVSPAPAPTIQNVPPAITINCDDALPALNDLPYDNGLTGTCQITGTVSGTQSGTIDPCVASTITYTWSGNDICGNPLTPVTQTITVNPAPAPTIQNVPADVTIDCDDPLPALNDLTYDNNLTGTCQITGTVSGTQSGTIDPCVISTITYTWSGNDICGNPLTPVTQTIMVNPAPAPTIQNVPSAITINCDDALPALNDLTYDNGLTGTCQITGTVSGTQSGTIDPCVASTITYTWSGNDICGNPLTPVTQTITVNPAPAPTIQNVPPAITINCDDALPALNDLTYDNGLTGTCQITGTVSGTQSGTIDPCGISTITYTWSGNDICGNPLTPVTQTITVNSAPAPTIQNVPPADVTIDCDDPLPALNDLTYDNNLTGTCQITGTVSGTQSGTIDPCVISTITYTWSGNDICGNPLTPVTQTITVSPAPAPTIQNVPPAITINCDDALPALNDLPYDNGLTGTCQITGTVSGTQSGTIDPCVASTITYTWSGNDICGNPLTPVTQTITVNPAPAPTIQNVPADVTIDCDDPLPALNDLTYDNNLTGTCQITGTVSGTQSGTIDPCVASTITYTWSGNDICGNPLTPVTQTITVNPAPAPTIQNVPADVTIDCDDPLPALNDLTYDNNLIGTCQITGTVSGTQSGTIDPCVASTITYTWSGNDICGNPLTPVTQTITVNPAPAPTIQNVPADVTIDCDDPLPALNDLTYDNNLTGTCQITGTVSGTQSGTIDPCVASTITYTWSGNDICGNPLTPVTQTITVNPAPAPTIQNVPADVTIDCDDPLPALNDLTYDNNITGTCQITGTVSGTQSGTIDPCVASTITYTWSGNDICGNPLTPVTQTITVNPAPAPTIQNVPADVTIDCDDPLPALNDLTYDNNLTGTCQITGTVSGTQSGTIDPCVASTITYTWSGNDICGNPLTPVTQTITVNPAPAPTIQNVPAAVTIDCDDPLPALNDLTYDNNLTGTCQITGTVSGTQSGTIDPCVISTITYTWSGNDICGNPLTPVTQTITVNPAPTPTIQNVPADVTIDCDDPLPALNDLTYDNNLTGTCQITGTVSGTQSGTIDPCVISTITYTWSGNDICGNPLTPVTQTITVNPAPAPTIQNVPSAITINCDDPLPALNDLTYDNGLTGTCQITGTVSGVQSGTIDPCVISTITYTWSGNDICGNPLTPVTQTITVNPAPAPTIQNVPPAITINCDDALPALNDLTYDNGLTGTCQITGTVSGTQSGTIDPCVISTITYTWSGNDICGNPLTPVTQTITVNPAPTPTIQNVPADVTIDCDDPLPALNDLTYDNNLTGTCQITGTVSGTQSGTIDPCVISTITYTWSGNDICGNPLTPVTQTITVNPAPAPTIQNVPPAITINCDDALPALNDLTYDNGLTGTCQITGTVSGTQSGTIDPCGISTITYTWSGNDICGNPLTPVTQTITVNPAPAPTIQNVPADLTIDCDDPLPALNDLTYDNNLTGTCQITGTVSGTQSGIIDPCVISTITYTWSGNDICGNPLIPVTQTITVNPAPAPTIQNVPSAITINCDDALPALNDLTYDNGLTGTCQITGTVSGTQSGTIDPCIISTITYTWSGNDILRQSADPGYPNHNGEPCTSSNDSKCPASHHHKLRRCTSSIEWSHIRQRPHGHLSNYRNGERHPIRHHRSLRHQHNHLHLVGQ